LHFGHFGLKVYLSGNRLDKSNSHRYPQQIQVINFQYLYVCINLIILFLPLRLVDGRLHNTHLSHYRKL